MPSNLYGVANAAAFTTKVIPGGNINPVPGVETTLIASPALVAPSQGYFYCGCFVTSFVLYGATLPSGWTINARIGSGSDFDSYTVNMGGITANEYFTYTTTLFSPSFSTPWSGAGSVVNVTVTMTGAGSSMTFAGAGTQCWFLLLRAPDQ